MDIKVYFSDNLRYLRKAHKMSQTDIGKLVGKSYNAIYKWERSIAEPTLADVFIIASYFNIPVEVLLYKDITQTAFAVSKK